MQCVKLQGSANPVTLLDLSTAHLSNTLQLNSASGTPADILLTSGDSNIRESGQDDRSNKSSWIRRLKPRDELGHLAEAACGTLASEKGVSAERMDISSRSVQPGCFPQDKATTASRVRPNWKIESAADAKKQKTRDQRVYDVAERVRMDVCQEKSMSETAAAPPSNVGFGPWVNLNSSRKPDMKVELKNTVGTTSAHESFKAVQGSFCTPPLSPIQSKLGLPPRPPSQKTLGFHPPSKITPLASVMGRGVFCQPARDIQLVDRQLSEAPSNRESAPARQVVGVQDKETSLFVEAAIARSGSSFQKPKASEQSSPFSVREHGKGLSDCGQQFFASSSTSLGNSDLPVKQLGPSDVERIAMGNDDVPVKQLCPSVVERVAMGNSDLPVKQLCPSVAEGVAIGNSDLPVKQVSPSVVAKTGMGQQPGNCSDGGVENGRRGVGDNLHVKMSVEGVKESIRADLPFDASGLTLHLRDGPTMEDSKTALENGPILQTASMERPLLQTLSVEPKKITPQQSPSRSPHGTSTPEKAGASTLNSASLPWEMFIEPAGASKKAREQFVEVFNRARDELKNQRMSLSRASTREMDIGPKLTLGPGGVVSDQRLERNLMKHEQHSAGHSQVQERLKISSQNPEHGTLSLSSNLREQHAISLSESKGPVSILENQQSGLRKDTALPLKSATPFKQAEVFGQVLTLPEGQLSLNMKTGVQEGDKKTACERHGEMSIVHGKGLRRRDKDGQRFSSNSAASPNSNPKELVSKLSEDIKCNGVGQAAGVSHQLDVNRGESIPVLGKRSEDHAFSRVAEKGAVSCARPQIWLQRWHPTAAYNLKGLQDSQVPSDGKRNDSVGFLALGVKKFKDSDGVGVFSRVREASDVAVADKQKGVRSLKTSSSKMLPSAAAMAIVGTAARQFCSAQPQRKGSFAFWSGFRMPPPPCNVEPIQEEGKGKLLLGADVKMPNH
eukprot:c24235_g1_i1 orf=687-3554(-)